MKDWPFQASEEMDGKSHQTICTNLLTLTSVIEQQLNRIPAAEEAVLSFD
jgi:hypothetical protein